MSRDTYSFDSENASQAKPKVDNQTVKGASRIESELINIIKAEGNKNRNLANHPPRGGACGDWKAWAKKL